MSFFGLTALGPQSVFQSNWKANNLVDAFKLIEYVSGYDRVVGKEKVAKREQLTAIIDKTWLGPAPEAVHTSIGNAFAEMEAFDRATFEGKIKDLIDACAAERASGKGKPTEYTSHKQLKADARWV